MKIDYTKTEKATLIKHDICLLMCWTVCFLFIAIAKKHGWKWQLPAWGNMAFWMWHLQKYNYRLRQHSHAKVKTLGKHNIDEKTS